MEPTPTPVNQQAFTRQAETFADPRYNGVLTEASDWVFTGIPRRRDDLVLDIAAGTGLGGRALAPDVRQVVALDATEAMLSLGAQEAHKAGLSNMLFMRGEAGALPFLEDSFRIALCRYALHHFPDPRVELAEIKRVLMPRGWLGLADMVVSEHAEIAERQNRIEFLRDGSHARALSGSQLQDLLVRSGFEVAGAETREVRRPLEPWLAQTGAGREAVAEIRELLTAEAKGGREAMETGFCPRREEDGSISFVHVLTSLLVLNPDA